MSLFITFEGIEGCGKSTQSNKLTTYFADNNIPFIHTREPGGTNISEKIRNILLDVDNKEMNSETELLLYMASRSQHVGEKILPSLNSGKNVICDRFYDSTIAYQGAARALDRKFIMDLVKFATYNTNPDVTFFLDIPVDESFKRMDNRGKKDRIELEKREFHEKVRNEFLSLAKQFSERYVIIDGTKKESEIHQMIIDEINKRQRSFQK